MADASNVNAKNSDYKLVYHVPNSDAKSDEQARKTNLDATSKALISCLSGHKGSGDGVYYVDANGKKITASAVKDEIKRLDSNNDGVILFDEAVKNNANAKTLELLGFNCDETQQKKIQETVKTERLVEGIKGLSMGLNIGDMIWKSLAKGIVSKSTTKENLLEMYSEPKVREYYNQEVWGSKSDAGRKHSREMFQEKGFTEQDLKKCGFTDEQVKYFLSK